ncbi:hypothetical protein LKF67_1244 [Lactococcus lactis subsp. lactis]|nr:hypothetical protein LKF67_1244 [Lactococcus lactis subsp. lactis]
MSPEEAQLFFNVSPLFFQIDNKLLLLDYPRLFNAFNLSYEKNEITGYRINA